MSEAQKNLDFLREYLVTKGYVDRSLANQWSLKEAAESSEVIGEILASEDVSGEALAEAVSVYLDCPLYDRDLSFDETHASQNWFYGHSVEQGGVLYFSNPLKSSEVQIALSQYPSAGVGVISQETLYQLSASSEDDVVVESDNEARQLLEEIMQEAVSRKVSDVHLDPFNEDTVAVRMRIDGTMVRVKSLQHVSYENLAGIILTEAGVTAGEYNEPRDGQFPWPVGQRNINVRMAMTPVRIGVKKLPKFTLRLLGLESNLMKLEALGLSERQNHILRKTSLHPNGLALVTGPTGSGKTTTLMAFLRYLKDKYPGKSIFTIEDPVEVEIPGINQLEVSKQMSFSNGLKTLLRQDPDIILIGEIRDGETMELAIKAALTGHFVLSTMHTNTALGTISRMLNMGAQPDLLADTLVAMTAQRMIKTLCPDCRIPEEWGTRVDHRPYIGRFNAPAMGDTVFTANEDGCRGCGYAGFSGRRSVAEMIQLDATSREMIGDREPIQKIAGYLIGRRGEHPEDSLFEGIWDHGLGLLSQGVVDLDSLIHLLGPLEINEQEQDIEALPSVESLREHEDQTEGGL